MHIARPSEPFPFDLNIPPELPIRGHAEAIARAILEHPVVIVAGETGSGKTTQLPKIALALGRRRIACTQPRRIAATTMARRVAEELNTPLGGRVGYRIRFQAQCSERTQVIFATDGMLLAEIHQDPELSAYDTLIIDEAHERSLNIDVLLGHAKRLLERRADLKLVISSATLDVERFSRHFGGAPVIQVAGRCFPVETRYLPLGEDDDLPEAVAAAVEEGLRQASGDVLVFLSGERDIREAKEALEGRGCPVPVLPLHARLTQVEQARVFERKKGRRVILATNVAETSITLPQVDCVVDSGLARINRFSPRTGVERLKIEPISKASAEQRRGRAGRTAPGLCLRLYSEEDFAARPPFTDPEILRTSLASAILRMKALGLGDIEGFPFLDPPDRRQVRAAYQELREIGALDGEGGLTPLGERLAALPVEPRIGRIILAAAEEQALKEVLVIAAALSVQDPRERPMERREEADRAHARFADKRSDFMAWLRLWDLYRAAVLSAPSRSQLRKWCKAHFLSYQRLRAWEDVHRQLRGLVVSMGYRINRRPAGYGAIHRALLTGFLSRFGRHDDKGIYQGARGRRFAIFPGSGLRGKTPRWVVAAELVETRRLYGRCVARIRPEWLEAAGRHLCRREVGPPFWDGRRVMAHEVVTLYGQPILRRAIPFGPIDPQRAREVFLQEALVEGALEADLPFLRHNRALLEAIEALEQKARRPLKSDAALFAFYDRHLPQGIDSLEALARCCREHPEALFLDSSAFPIEGLREAFPDAFPCGGFPLSYRFAPGQVDDGITADIPLTALPSLPPEPWSWLVPGLLREKVEGLMRALPGGLRKRLVPIPDTASACLARMTPYRGSLGRALSEACLAARGVEVPEEAWREEALPPYLRMRFRIHDRGEVLAEGRDLEALRAQLEGRARERLAASWGRKGIRRWDFGALPPALALPGGGVAHPALRPEGQGLALALFPTPEEAERSHREGVVRLIALHLGRLPKLWERDLPLPPQAVLGLPLDERTLRRQIVARALEKACLSGGLPRSREAFEACLEAGRGRVWEEACRLAEAMEAIAGSARRLTRALANPKGAHREAYRDMADHFGGLVHPDVVSHTPLTRLLHTPRYLKALEHRLERLPRRPERDKANREAIAPYWQGYKARAKEGASLEDFRLLLEEWRVALFAQHLGTAFPVSHKKVAAAWAAISAATGSRRQGAAPPR